MTTNLGIASWGKVFNDDPMVACAEIITDAYRHVAPKSLVAQLDATPED